MNNERLPITGSCEVTLPFISGNHTVFTMWRCVYDFSRTAAVTLRRMFLKGTGLLQFYNPNSSSPSKEQNDGSIVMDPPTGLHNYQNHFAGNVLEAVWISSFFDINWHPNFLKDWLSGIETGETRSLTGELIVIDNCHHTSWQIVVSLQVKRIDIGLQAVPIQLQAVPIVKVVHRGSNVLPDLTKAMSGLALANTVLH